MDKKNQQKFIALQLALIISFISTLIIYGVDTNLLKHNDFNPLTEFQFYGVLFLIVFGLVCGLLFYREEEVEAKVSGYKKKMNRKKMKKTMKAKAR